MIRPIIFSAVLLAALCLAPVPASAQRGRPANPGGGKMEGSSAGSSSHGDHAANTSASSSGQAASEILSRNTKLSSKISTLTGMDAKTACAGFKNLGQCMAAAHVSKNLGISFADLKTKVMGGDSLGKSIKALDPQADAKAAIKKGNKQAQDDLHESEA